MKILWKNFLINIAIGFIPMIILGVIVNEILLIRGALPTGLIFFGTIYLVGKIRKSPNFN